MKRITIDLPDETYRELKIRSATEAISMADIVRRLVKDYVVDKPKKR